MRTIARGALGVLRSGMHFAATIHGWEVSIPDDRFVDGSWTLNGKIGKVDKFYVTQTHNMSLALSMGNHTWKWKTLNSVEVTGSDIVIKGEGRPNVS